MSLYSGLPWAAMPSVLPLEGAMGNDGPDLIFRRRAGYGVHAELANRRLSPADPHGNNAAYFPPTSSEKSVSDGI